MKTLAAGTLALGAALSLAGCSPKYILKATEAESPVLPSECELQVFDQAPDQPYSVVGTISPENADNLAERREDFLGAVRPWACRHGANAIIAIRDDKGRYFSGMAISVR